MDTSQTITVPRLSGESVCIGDDIEVAVAVVDGTITLGVRCPKSVAVVPKECFRKKQPWWQRLLSSVWRQAPSKTVLGANRH